MANSPARSDYVGDDLLDFKPVELSKVNVVDPAAHQRRYQKETRPLNPLKGTDAFKQLIA